MLFYSLFYLFISTSVLFPSFQIWPQVIFLLFSFKYKVIYLRYLYFLNVFAVKSIPRMTLAVSHMFKYFAFQVLFVPRHFLKNFPLSCLNLSIAYLAMFLFNFHLIVNLEFSSFYWFLAPYYCDRSSIASRMLNLGECSMYTLKNMLLWDA